MGVTIFNNKRLFHPDTVRYITKVAASSLPPYVHQRRIEELVLGIKIDSEWGLYDRLWIFAHTAGSQILSLVSLINANATNASEVNSPTWTALQGYTGNSVNMSINTNYNPAVDGVNFTQNSAALGIYSRTNSITSVVSMGATVAGNGNTLNLRTGVDVFGRRVNSGSVNAGANANSLGLHYAYRTGAVNSTVGKNGADINTSASASVAVVSGNIFILCNNADGVAAQFSGRQYSMAYLGSGSINQSKLFLRFERYMDQLATGVV